jgi:hypothetical protein
MNAEVWLKKGIGNPLNTLKKEDKTCMGVISTGS